MSSESKRSKFWPFLRSLVLVVLMFAAVYFLLLPKAWPAFSGWVADHTMINSQNQLVIGGRAEPYTPTAEIQEVAVRAGFTPEAEELFWTTQPKFGYDCPGDHSGGCFFIIRSELLDQSMGRLTINPDGLWDPVVVATHELLHAAWHELPAAERQSLSDQIDRLLDDEHPQAVYFRDELLAMYGSQMPQELFYNEMHSYLGTVAPGLPPQWETYYGWYFTDRQAIVDFDIAWNEQLEANNS